MTTSNEDHPESNLNESVNKPESPSGTDWQRDLLSRLSMASLNEQRRSRRWSVFFKSLAFIYLTILLIVVAKPAMEGTPSGQPHTAVVNVDGVIANEAFANADAINEGLRAAYDNDETVAVIVRINSPGGSPVQAGYVYDEMMRLRAEHPDIPMYAVIEDLGASGGYYIAAGAEKIYADKASIVGSIGVRMDSFGFVETIKKLGIERRLMTAGDNKGMLDPFLPENPDDRSHIQTMLNQIHQQFIAAIKSSRGDRLQENPEIFSGMFWTGEQSLKYGLIDGLGSVDYIAREVIGEKRLRDFTRKQDFWQRLSDSVESMGGKAITQMLSTPRIQ